MTDDVNKELEDVGIGEDCPIEFSVSPLFFNGDILTDIDEKINLEDALEETPVQDTQSKPDYSTTVHVPIYPHWDGGVYFAQVPFSELTDPKNSIPSFPSSESVYEPNSDYGVPILLHERDPQRLVVHRNGLISEVMKNVTSTIENLLTDFDSVRNVVNKNVTDNRFKDYLSAPEEGMRESLTGKVTLEHNGETYEVNMVFYEQTAEKRNEEANYISYLRGMQNSHHDTGRDYDNLEFF